MINERKELRKSNVQLREIERKEKNCCLLKIIILYYIISHKERNARRK